MLLPPARAIRTGPATAGATDWCRARSWAEFEYPSLEAHNLPDALLRGEASGVITGREIVLPFGSERTMLQFPHHTIPGFIDRSAGRTLTFNRCRPAPAGIFVGAAWPQNYFHWMSDCLPRLWLADRLLADAKTLPILVPESAYRVPAVRESIAALAPDRALFMLEAGSTYRAERIILLDGVRTTLGNSPLPASDSSVLHEAAMTAFRAELLQSLGVAGVQRKPGQRVLIERPERAKRGYNTLAVRDALAPLGFRPVDPSSLTLAEQARLFAEADIICGASGAAMTNLLFMSGGARAIVWGFEPMLGLMGIWSNLVALAGGEIAFLPVQVAPGLSLLEYTTLSEYHVNVAALLRCVRDFIGDAAPS